MIHINRQLAAKLETAEALNQVEFVLAQQQFASESTAAFVAIGSGYAVFAGVDSPLTQCFGLGLDGEVGEDQVFALETFYQAHGAAVNVEVSHLSDLSLTLHLIERGYKISEYSNVLVKTFDNPEPFTLTSGAEVRRIREDEIDGFAKVISRGFIETGDVPQSFIELFQIFFRQKSGALFGAFVEGSPAGGGAVFIQSDVATFGGASTLVEYRNRGIQSDLLRCRLEYALSRGCQWAMVTTLPGSVSQRNVEKRGFQVAYARTKFFLPCEPPTEKTET
jgi:GNAT superfamily N-acetyltransferase